MMEEIKSYRKVMKATSLFGGVQVANILISIIKTKIIAVLLGPAGMGIAGLLNASLGILNSITALGLDKSAVKEISVNYNNPDSSRSSRVVALIKKIVWYTAVSGTLLMIFLSGVLSEWAFGNKNHQLDFILISAALLFTQLANSRLAILQGFRKLRKLAKANLLGNFLGLLFTVPLYFVYGIDAIAPAIVIASLLSFVCSIYYSNQLSITRFHFTGKEVFSESKEMLRLGISLSLSGIMALIVAYVVRIFVSQKGGLEEVGFYSAGIVILNSYVGLIFNAMAADYFPRLSEIAENIQKIRKIVYEQALIAVLLITPIIVLFLILAPFIIEILYSEAFFPVLLFLSWGILGMFFKAVSFCMGYIIIAKGDSRLFMMSAVCFNLLMLGLNMLGYYYGGLAGLGISFLLYYLIHFIGVKLIAKNRYDFYFEKGFYRIFFICLFLCFITLILFFLEDEVLKYLLMALMVFISSVFSFVQLDKKMNIKELMNNFFKRKK